MLLVTAGHGIFRGHQDTRTPLYLGAEIRFLAAQMVAAAAAAATVLLFVLPFGWGLPGVWWGIVTLMGLRALVLSGHWVGRRPLTAPAR